MQMTLHDRAPLHRVNSPGRWRAPRLVAQVAFLSLLPLLVIAPPAQAENANIEENAAIEVVSPAEGVLLPRSGSPNEAETTTTGPESNSFSETPSISSDGRLVAFGSYASNLVPSDNNGYQDVFLRDRSGLTTSLVSVSSSGTQGNSKSTSPSISADGRFVAFDSYANNLVPGDTNGTWDIFVRDLLFSTTTRVSVSSSGIQGTYESFGRPSVSDDGRFIAFWSYASNLVAGDTNNSPDIFVRDRSANTTVRISVTSSGGEANSYSQLPSVSSDGRYVAFESYASNLVSGDSNGRWDVFVRDTATGTTSRVSVDSAGNQATGTSASPSISGNGQYVAFSSTAKMHVFDNNGRSDIYVRDRSASVTIFASEGYCPPENGNSVDPAISRDGAYVAYVSTSPLWCSDSNGSADVYEYGMFDGRTRRLSENMLHGDTNGLSASPALSGDGRAAAFESQGSNLVADANLRGDVFVHQFEDDEREECCTSRASEGTDTQVALGAGDPPVTGPVHHIATNKNNVSARTGGPWTPRFKAIFDAAGMSLDDALNKVSVPGHVGPHPAKYHQIIFDRLTQAVRGKVPGTPGYRQGARK